MGLNEGSGEQRGLAGGVRGWRGKRGDEWLHRGILGSGHAEAFLMALYEKWRECDRSQMEPTANWLDFLRCAHSHSHTHTLTFSANFFFCPPSFCFGKAAARVSSPSEQLSCVRPASTLGYLQTFVWPQADSGRPAGADGDKLHHAEGNRMPRR